MNRKLVVGASDCPSTVSREKEHPFCLFASNDLVQAQQSSSVKDRKLIPFGKMHTPGTGLRLRISCGSAHAQDRLVLCGVYVH